MNWANALGLVGLGFYLGMACCLLFADGIRRTNEQPDRSGEDAKGIRANPNTNEVSQ